MVVFRQLSLLALAVLPLSLAQVSNDFESGWDQTAWPIYAPDCNQGGTVSLDTTIAHSGSNSMKVTSPGGYCGHIFFGTTQVPSGDVYVRTWLKSTELLTSSHITFITMPDSAQPAGKHLRIGGQNQILMYNRESDDATLPDLSPQGSASSAALPAGSWECFEYHLGTDGSIETWLNGVAIVGLTTANNPNAQQWTRSTIKPKITGVYFGWESYGSDTNTFWYDDISVGSSRVGCDGGGTVTTTSVRVPTTTTTTTTRLSTTLTTSPRISTTTTNLVTSRTSAIPTTAITPSTTTTTTTTTRITTTSASGGTIPKWGQCGGLTWSGSGTCVAGSTCKYSHDWYSQCL